jgi:serine O-acetyltransferase
MNLTRQIQDDLTTYGGDWTRQGFWAIAVHRLGNWRYGVRFVPARKLLSALYKIAYKIVQIVSGIELPCEAKLGRNFRIDHFGGVVVSGYATFGDNCVIRNGVTIGLRHIDQPEAPTLGNNVSVGAGAKVLGPISIGDNVEIGANAVVLDDVPSNSTAVGIPARIIPKQKSKQKD